METLPPVPPQKKKSARRLRRRSPVRQWFRVWGLGLRFQNKASLNGYLFGVCSRQPNNLNADSVQPFACVMPSFGAASALHARTSLTFPDCTCKKGEISFLQQCRDNGTHSLGKTPSFPKASSFEKGTAVGIFSRLTFPRKWAANSVLSASVNKKAVSSFQSTTLFLRPNFTGQCPWKTVAETSFLGHIK
jgi:hypothetical protein